MKVASQSSRQNIPRRHTSERADEFHPYQRQAVHFPCPTTLRFARSGRSHAEHSTNPQLDRAASLAFHLSRFGNQQANQRALKKLLPRIAEKRRLKYGACCLPLLFAATAADVLRRWPT